MKKLYIYLEKKTNAHLSYVMEALVGIMRHVKLSDNISVELYLRIFEGFMIALDRVDIKKLNVEFCQDHLDLIESSLSHEF